MTSTPSNAAPLAEELPHDLVELSSAVANLPLEFRASIEPFILRVIESTGAQFRINRRRAGRGWTLNARSCWWIWTALACAVGCSNGTAPTATQSTSSVTSSATTTSVPGALAVRYIGSFGEVPPLPIDLSLYFTLSTNASRIGTRAVYQVTGSSGYNTPGAIPQSSLVGNVFGTVDGTPDNGTFSGIVTANLSNGCIAQRRYSGAVSRSAVSWIPGDRVQTCGTLAVLTSAISAVASPDAPTTSVTSTTTTTIPTTSTISPTPAPPPESSTSTITTTTTTSIDVVFDFGRRNR